MADTLFYTLADTHDTPWLIPHDTPWLVLEPTNRFDNETTSGNWKVKNFSQTVTNHFGISNSANRHYFGTKSIEHTQMITTQSPLPSGMLDMPWLVQPDIHNREGQVLSTQCTASINSLRDIPSRGSFQSQPIATADGTPSAHKCCKAINWLPSHNQRNTMASGAYLHVPMTTNTTTRTRTICKTSRGWPVCTCRRDNTNHGFIPCN